MIHLFRSLALLVGVAVTIGALAAPAHADSGSVWTLGQDGRVLNKVGTWERAGNGARINLLGTTQFLDVNMTEPISSAEGVTVFIYAAIDTLAQPANPGIWKAVSRGEVALDGNTAANNSMDGWWRRTERIETYPDMLKVVPDVSPPQRIRFVVETR